MQITDGPARPLQIPGGRITISLWVKFDMNGSVILVQKAQEVGDYNLGYTLYPI